MSGDRQPSLHACRCSGARAEARDQDNDQEDDREPVQRDSEPFDKPHTCSADRVCGAKRQDEPDDLCAPRSADVGERVCLTGGVHRRDAEQGERERDQYERPIDVYPTHRHQLTRRDEWERAQRARDSVQTIGARSEQIMRYVLPSMAVAGRWRARRQRRSSPRRVTTRRRSA